MELSPKQQIIEAIKGAENILLLTHRTPDGDAIGSILALSLALTKIGKSVTAVCADKFSPTFDYIANFGEMISDLSGRRDFVISLDISQTKPAKFHYQVVDEKINFIVSPKNGEFAPEMVSFPAGKFKFDCIIILDCVDLERIGKPYSENPDLFYEIPIINIDHHSGNDQFGKINLVDITATSTAEILVSVFEALSKDTSLITEDVATALLTGIITDTNSFQNQNTTPKSLTVAAQLVAANANRDEIIKRIYKSRTLQMLRIWGKVLSNIRDERNYHFLWTQIRKEEFLAVGASPDDANGVMDELLKTATGVDFVLLLKEKDNSIYGNLRSVAKGVDVSLVAKIFAGGGHPLAAGFIIENSELSASVDSIIAKIRDHQKALNGQSPAMRMTESE